HVEAHDLLDRGVGVLVGRSQRGRVAGLHVGSDLDFAFVRVLVGRGERFRVTGFHVRADGRLAGVGVAVGFGERRRIARGRDLADLRFGDGIDLGDPRIGVVVGGGQGGRVAGIGDLAHSGLADAATTFHAFQRGLQGAQVYRVGGADGVAHVGDAAQVVCTADG